jgi:N-formylglutamate amidohydrolase
MEDAEATEVLFVRAPRATALPLLFDSPHSGTDYPDDFHHLPPRSQMRRSEDSFIDELYAAAPDYGATLIGALFPRIYIDPNRSALDIDPELLDEPWPDESKPGPKCGLGVGLIWRLCPPGDPIYDRRLTVAEARRRIERYHRPYQEAVSGTLNRLHEQFGAVWHINCHSMPSVSTEMAAEGPGVRRPDITLGDVDGTTCSAEFTALVRDALSGFGYNVTVNDPYKGAELIRAWSDPGVGRHSLQIEINRALYMDEEGLERNGGFDRLRMHVTGLIGEVAGYVRDRLA